MHVANEVGKYAGVSEGSCEIATRWPTKKVCRGGSQTRPRPLQNRHPFSIRNFQVIAAKGVTPNLNRAFAIRIWRLIATIGLSIPAIDVADEEGS